MNDSEFHQLADKLMLQLEETLDQFAGDADASGLAGDQSRRLSLQLSG
ncbi:hypothetical protein DES54_11229 [Brenneria salicis ATCC 15712 = DSM 30166]|uniref:Uncharacterized protein n=1 Tax=Brenneria salicis ATCC 15712 = DSM 30166 TaxID=714314 RepID=A0A366I4P8_9GAMM|nr:hypothetical protein DES54_11229 [Brenneria salicis ATCC 15712 = DSM 30166]